MTKPEDLIPNIFPVGATICYDWRANKAYHDLLQVDWSNPEGLTFYRIDEALFSEIEAVRICAGENLETTHFGLIRQATDAVMTALINGTYPPEILDAIKDTLLFITDNPTPFYNLLHPNCSGSKVSGFCYYGSSSLIFTQPSPEIIWHEIGHVLDQYLGFPSESKKFLEAYHQDYYRFFCLTSFVNSCNQAGNSYEIDPEILALGATISTYFNRKITPSLLKDALHVVALNWEESLGFEPIGQPPQTPAYYDETERTGEVFAKLEEFLRLHGSQTTKAFFPNMYHFMLTQCRPARQESLTR